MNPEQIQPVVMEQERYNIFTDPCYIACQESSALWHENEGRYYEGVLCCQEIAPARNRSTLDTAFNNISRFIINSIEEIREKQQNKLCVLPKGHVGRCCHNPHAKMFADGLENKFDTGIYSTPGNDGYVFKNRHDRLFPIQLSSESERRIKNKDVKLNCAIPVKDASTPLMLASAYLDMLVFASNVRDITKAISGYWTIYEELLTSHKAKLTDVFAEKNRRVFNAEGFTECPVRGYEFKLEDFTRDSRVDPRETDVQLGHCLSRNDNRYTIRGFNITVMTREGNRLVGDYDFMDDIWINRLRTVVNRF